MPALTARPYDWRIDVHDLRLAPEALTGKKPHVVQPIPFLSQQISSTAELGYTDIDRDREVAFAMERFSGGLGEERRFKLEHQHKVLWSKGADTSFPQYVLPGPLVTTLGATITKKPTFAVQRGNITYVAAGSDLYQITNDTTRTLDTTFAVDITALLVWGGNIIVGLGSSTNFQSRASDTSGGAFTAATVPAHFLVALKDILYRAVRPNKLNLADQIGGPWAEFDVGDNSYNITSLTALEQVVLIGKEDGPYGFDDDWNPVPLAPELKIEADAQVCKVAIAFNRDYVFSSRLGMVRLRPGEGLKRAGLDLLAEPALPSNESRPTAFTSDGRFLYALVVPSAARGVYIWKRGLDDVWHNYVYRDTLGGTGLASADLLFATGKLGSTAKNAVLFAYQPTAGAYQLAYALFPATLDPTRDTNYRFETAADSKFRTLEYVASYPTVKKQSDVHKVVGDDFSSGRKITVDAYQDNEAAKLIGDFQKSPFTVLPIRNPLEYHRVSLEFTFKTDDSTKAPKIRAFHLSAQLLAPVVQRHVVQFLGSEAPPLRTGGRSREPWDEKVKLLRSLAASKAAVNMMDEDGRKFVAYVNTVTEWSAYTREMYEDPPVKILSAEIKEVAIEE